MSDVKWGETSESQLLLPMSAVHFPNIDTIIR